MDPQTEVPLDELYDDFFVDTGEPPFTLSDELAAAATVRRNNAGRETFSGNRQMSITKPGTYVEGVAAIEQSMWIILNTEPGSQPFEPEFGSEVFSLLDAASPTAAPLIAARIKRDLNRWEPRIVVSQVTHTQNVIFGGDVAGATSGVRFTIFWTGAADSRNEQVSDVVAIAPGSAIADGIYLILATDTGEVILTEAGETITII